MDDQRLERALRAGPPFRTSYLAGPLAIEPEPVTRRRPLVLTLVVASAVIALIAVRSQWEGRCFDRRSC